MQSSSRIPIYFEGMSCGEAEVLRDGLYYEITCRSEIVSAEILRAYADWDNERICLGVMVPEGDVLQLRRRLPVSHWREGPEPTLTLSQFPEGWSPWSGTVLDCEVTKALSTVARGRRTVAMPFSHDTPFAYMRLFCLCRPVQIGGERYLAIDLPG